VDGVLGLGLLTTLTHYPSTINTATAIAEALWTESSTVGMAFDKGMMVVTA